MSSQDQISPANYDRPVTLVDPHEEPPTDGPNSDTPESLSAGATLAKQLLQAINNHDTAAISEKLEALDIVVELASRTQGDTTKGPNQIGADELVKKLLAIGEKDPQMDLVAGVNRAEQLLMSTGGRNLSPEARMMTTIARAAEEQYQVVQRYFDGMQRTALKQSQMNAVMEHLKKCGNNDAFEISDIVQVKDADGIMQEMTVGEILKANHVGEALIVNDDNKDKIFKDKYEALEAAIKNENERMSNFNQIENAKVQQANTHYSQLFEMLTTMLKKYTDTTSSIIRNF